MQALWHARDSYTLSCPRLPQQLRIKNIQDTLKQLEVNVYKCNTQFNQIYQYFDVAWQQGNRLNRAQTSRI